jgi:hypothetical protein
MTQFQILALGVFVGVVAVAYRKELLSLVRGLLRRGGVQTPVTNKSIAVTIVDDLVAVTELRDKLASEDCPQGVEACTNLLRVIVEHIPPAKNV